MTDHANFLSLTMTCIQLKLTVGCTERGRYSPLGPAMPMIYSIVLISEIWRTGSFYRPQEKSNLLSASEREIDSWARYLDRKQVDGAKNCSGE